MTLYSQEHYDLMEQFEREHSKRRIERENKELWAQGHVYQNADINALFLAYRRGYAYGVALLREKAKATDATS